MAGKWEAGVRSFGSSGRRPLQPPSLLRHATGQQPDPFGFPLPLTSRESDHHRYPREQPRDEKTQTIQTTHHWEHPLLDNREKATTCNLGRQARGPWHLPCSVTSAHFTWLSAVSRGYVGTLNWGHFFCTVLREGGIIILWICRG